MKLSNSKHGNLGVKIQEMRNTSKRKSFLFKKLKEPEQRCFLKEYLMQLDILMSMISSKQQGKNLKIRFQLDKNWKDKRKN
jgi:hypothetical protein